MASFPARKYLRVLISALPTGGNINLVVTFNGDTGSNYSFRTSNNGSAYSDGNNQTGFTWYQANLAVPFFAILDIINIASQEKIVTGRTIHQNTAGAGNAPTFQDSVGKWTNTSNQITTITATENTTGSYAAGSQMVVLGHD